MESLGNIRIKISPAISNLNLCQLIMGSNVVVSTSGSCIGKKGQQLYFFNTENCLIFASAEGDDSERMRGCGGERE